MPHVIVEYTDNIAAEARMPELLAAINGVLIAQGGVFPTGGIRSRAIRLTDYRVADGAEDDAFVHVTLKIGSGRPEEVRKKACDELFAAIKDHFAELFARRYLALSMELIEFSEGGTYKHNNIHARFKKA
ncbi:5-carboxymethyl-2-hydroxymuconate Delta-isomerase [Azospirillum sp.]|uniref:5-carboxymethyl-2-hydroxymuconate Delta-isomerase n=1 Tax=Azospirillum sp. TaxID=34012 RepID=UPI002D2B1EEE|nr:5-carboxymethyl-2-hydroxymuconate Delta-isomerase [Azospirillum sp.]HYD68759.1 5-carboxymethyl-2-hydroxymuconate Delta-isomerase [Azospirillum sp.]